MSLVHCSQLVLWLFLCLYVLMGFRKCSHSAWLFCSHMFLLCFYRLCSGMLNKYCNKTPGIVIGPYWDFNWYEVNLRRGSYPYRCIAGADLEGDYSHPPWRGSLFHVIIMRAICPRPNSQTLKFHSPVSPDPLKVTPSKNPRSTNAKTTQSELSFQLTITETLHILVATRTSSLVLIFT